MSYGTVFIEPLLIVDGQVQDCPKRLTDMITSGFLGPSNHIFLQLRTCDLLLPFRLRHFSELPYHRVYFGKVRRRCLLDGCHKGLNSWTRTEKAFPFLGIQYLQEFLMGFQENGEITWLNKQAGAELDEP